LGVSATIRHGDGKSASSAGDDFPARWADGFSAKAGTDADFVLNQQGNELFAIHQTDRRCVGAFGLLLRALAEIAGRDDKTLFVCTETAARLLDDRRLNILFPPLHLHGKPRAYYIADCHIRFLI
jgi:hypothetical protein